MVTNFDLIMSQNLSLVDKKQLEEQGVTLSQMEGYRVQIEKGFSPLNLVGNCRLEKEIKVLEGDNIDYFTSLYQENEKKTVLKFVPASGAASRMFKELHQASTHTEPSDAREKFKAGLRQFAFFNALESAYGKSIDDQLEVSEVNKLISVLLDEDGLGYGSLPKGSILFHKYDGGEVRTAFEEHFHEGAAYASRNGKSRIHFTLPAPQKESLDQFLASLKSCLDVGLKRDFDISSSIQLPHTDSPAIDAETGEWVRKEDGSLLFRPAGHGALIENINALDADLIFVKNIDNVVNKSLQESTTQYKQVLGGILIEVQDKIHKYLLQMDDETADLGIVAGFIEEWLSIPTKGKNLNDLRSILDRPLRVCGMVKNQGEPGGGPFVVADENGEPSLQIVEKAQIDLENPKQAELLKSATHFNPVDLVLGTRNHRGEKYDIMEFVNPEAGMVVSKSYLGSDIKALERPGLWNGAMYHWNTVFVEVPLETFNPVKTVFDLLRPAHL